MDLDGDGLRDVTSGSWPGELYLFRGTKEGGIDAPAKITHPDGKEIKRDSASAMFVADWNGDGRADLVVGNIDGAIVVYPGLERREDKKGPYFGMQKPIKVAGGGDLKLPGGDAGPCVADWDGDGRLDILAGDGEGKVSFYRGLVAKANDAWPAVATGVPLTLDDDKALPVGMRTKVAVCDWNNDGALDLLVGDFSSVQHGQWGEPGYKSEYHGHVYLFLRETAAEQGKAGTEH